MPTNQPDIHVAVLTAGRDRPYALGLAFALIEQRVRFDYVGSDGVDDPKLHLSPLFNFLNIRDQRENTGFFQRSWRVVAYYRGLISYGLTARPRIFHILWNNKFELLDRTVLMLFYKWMGKRIVMTAHNVNAGRRDGNDSWLNQWSLRFQYRLADHIFVHTGQMKSQLLAEFRIVPDKVTVIPFGINNSLPTTALTTSAARERLGIGASEKTILFFGNIAPYKGLEHLVAALGILCRTTSSCRLIIAGKQKGCDDYWAMIEEEISRQGVDDRVIKKIEYIPDEDVEVYFKAADILVLPYKHIFQSGVLFLGYSFGLPVVATDVGSLKEEIIEGKTGFVCRPENAEDLARCLSDYFGSDLYRNLAQRRDEIRRFANERYSWTKVGEMTREIYASLLA